MTNNNQIESKQSTNAHTIARRDSVSWKSINEVDTLRRSSRVARTRVYIEGNIELSSSCKHISMSFIERATQNRPGPISRYSRRAFFES